MAESVSPAERFLAITASIVTVASPAVVAIGAITGFVPWLYDHMNPVSATLIVIGVAVFTIGVIARVALATIRWRRVRKLQQAVHEEPVSNVTKIFDVHGQAQIVRSPIDLTIGGGMPVPPPFTQPPTLFPSKMSDEAFRKRLHRLSTDLAAWLAEREDHESYAYSPKGRAAELGYVTENGNVSEGFSSHHTEMLKQAQIRDAETESIFSRDHLPQVIAIAEDARARGYDDPELHRSLLGQSNRSGLEVSKIVIRLAVLDQVVSADTDPDQASS